MAKTTLVGPDIDGGELLLKKLDAASIAAPAALWLYDFDSERWSLVIGSPLVDQDGRRNTYKKIQTILRSSPEIEMDLADITVVGMQDKLVQALRSLIHTGAGLSGVRLTHNMINGVSIEDSYIYRLM